MALDKSLKDYFYNLGRTTAIVEIMNNMPVGFLHKVTINAFAYLPFHLNKALANDKHNLHKELLEPAEVVLMSGRDMPKGLFTGEDKNGRFAIGYYHEKHYLNEKYHGIFGKEETYIEEHTPEAVTPKETNVIDELAR